MVQAKTLADTPITRFFSEFERRSDRGEFASLLLQFADPFMAASPQGTHCVRLSDFASVLPKRKAFFNELGCQSTQLARIEEMPLNTRYVLVHTRWRMAFLRAGKEKEALADSTFIIDTRGQSFKIVFYLTQQDHMTMLKEQGILST